MKDIIIAIGGIFLLAFVILACFGSSTDCSNAKVVRDVDQVYYNQDSIDSAYYHHKADSMIRAIRAKSERRMRDE